MHIFDAAPLAEYCPAAPPALCDLIHLMLRKVPSHRPSAADIRQAMQRIALEILDDSTEFASYAITTAPVGEDDRITQPLKARSAAAEAAQ